VDGCPAGALELVEATVGELFESRTRFGPMVHARLRPGAENSGKLVAAVRQRAAALAGRQDRPLVLADGPPGIGCPVIASLSGADAVVVVTEPSASALHDLGRVLDLAAHFGLPAAVVINKADLSADLCGRIESHCADRDVPVLGRLAFDRVFVDALVAGRTVLEHAPDSAAAAAVRALWTAVCGLVQEPCP
jgi:MinD superfamily P-loop ATPase